MQFDTSQLRQLEEKKIISIQRHPTLPLLIHNYTPMCQFQKAWDDLSLQCRGLITDLEGNVVARPFRKFFNLSEHEGHQVSGHEGFRLPAINWKQNFTALKKYDGSLGILYLDGDRLRLATRGSFTSDQAEEGTAILYEKGYATPQYGYCLGEFTYLFEIIYPQNRVVVDYKGMRDLILLDMIYNKTGEGVPYSIVESEAKRIGCPVAERLPATPELLQACSIGPDNEEGYVVRFDDGMRVKIKFPEYVRLHRLVTGVSNKSIWESLSDGRGIEELLERVPDEFNNWVRKTVKELRGAFDEHLNKATAVYLDTKSRLGTASRKEYALEFNQHRPYTSVLFSLLDGKSPDSLLWKMVKPTFCKPFSSDIDA